MSIYLLEVFFIMETMEGLLKYLLVNIPLVPQYAYDNLEYIVAGVGGIGVVGYMKLKKINNNANDLTSLIIKQKKYSEAVNKRVR